MTKRNRRAAHQASPAQPDVGEDRDVRPPRNRALATLAIRSRRDDRKIARQPVGNHADEAADARAEHERERAADSSGHLCHRVTAFPAFTGLVDATLTITLRSRGPSNSTNITPCHLPSASLPRRIG